MACNLATHLEAAAPLHLHHSNIYNNAVELVQNHRIITTQCREKDQNHQFY